MHSVLWLLLVATYLHSIFAIPELQVLCNNDVIYPNDQLLVRVKENNSADEQFSIDLVNKGGEPLYFSSEIPTISNPNIVPGISYSYSDYNSGSDYDSYDSLPPFLVPHQRVTVNIKCGSYGTTYIDFSVKRPHSRDTKFRIFVSVLNPQHFRGLYPSSGETVIYVARHKTSTNHATSSEKKINSQVGEKSTEEKPKENIKNANPVNYFANHFTRKSPAVPKMGAEAVAESFLAYDVQPQLSTTTSSSSSSSSSSPSPLDTVIFSRADVILLSVVLPLVAIAVVVTIVLMVVMLMRRRYAEVMRMTPSQLDQALKIHELQL